MSAKTMSRATPWRVVFVVCRKCGKKLGGGFGRKGKDSLRDVLRESLRETGRRRDVRVCETSCLGVCPKAGVTALNATRPGVVHVIPAGADGAAAMGVLLGGDVVSDGRGVDGRGVEAAGLAAP
jgi:hypothetical protein